MWNHYCLQEQSSMGVGDDEPCNWCGAVEVALVQAANEEDIGSCRHRSTPVDQLTVS